MVKFNKNGLVTVRRIMLMLGFGHYPAHIARELGKSKGNIAYFIEKLLKLQYITKQEDSDQLTEPKSMGHIGKTRGLITLYRITQNGSNFLVGIEKGLKGKTCRLHNLYIKYPILKPPADADRIDWRRVELNNWTQLIGRECGLTVRMNPDSIEIIAPVVDGTNVFKLLFKGKDECDTLADYLESKLRMALGRGKVSRKPHFGVYDPVAGKFTKFFELSTDIGKMDESEGFGELDFFTPEAADAYLHMPMNVQRVQQTVHEVKQTVHDLELKFEQKFEEIADATKDFSLNFNSHIGAVKELGLAGRDLGSVTMDLKDVVADLKSEKRKEKREDKREAEERRKEDKENRAMTRAMSSVDIGEKRAEGALV